LYEPAALVDMAMVLDEHPLDKLCGRTQSNAVLGATAPTEPTEPGIRPAVDVREVAVNRSGAKWWELARATAMALAPGGPTARHEVARKMRMRIETTLRPVALFLRR